MSADEIDLQEVRVLRLQPGDTVVLNLDWSPSDDAKARIAAKLKEQFPDNDSIVVPRGFLSVARPEAAPAEELRTPSVWADAEGITIHDPDGWRGARDLPAKRFDEPITQAEYRRRRQISTVGPISALLSDEPSP